MQKHIIWEDRSSADLLEEGNSASREVTAFTLAEVLITLGVIGVVAALTLPIVINKTQDKVLENQYAKAKNIVYNGYRLMMTKTENFKVENLPFLNDCNALNEKACISKEHKKAFNIAADSVSGLDSELMPKDYIIQGQSENSQFNWDDVPYIFATADGMTYGVLSDEDISSFSVVADVNGIKNPNTVKKDLYKFRFSGNGKLSDVSGELEIINGCSAENLSKCTTQEECLAISPWAADDGGCYYTTWLSYNNSCVKDWGYAYSNKCSGVYY